MASLPDIVSRERPKHDATADVLIVGAGACGLVAALAANDAGADVVIVERDASPLGSTSMSSGFVPAAGTRFQKSAGVNDDDPDLFLNDILKKSGNLSVPHLARMAAHTIGPALEWLAGKHGLEWIVLDDFLYPGHSRHRMHAVPEKTGAALLSRLLAAVEAAGIPVVTNAQVVRLFGDDDSGIDAVEVIRPDGGSEIIGCQALILACSGFGGNRELVARYIPELAAGLYFGHAGNTGDALSWGQALGAKVEHLSGYQGHGSLAHPHGILISWALMTKGAIQVNAEGRRFSDESGGYSEQAVHVLRQPGGVAWNLYGETIHEFALGFPDYRQAVEAGAVRTARDIPALADLIGAPRAVLTQTLADVAAFASGAKRDALGRDFAGLAPIAPPFHAVKVSGALFHTQGGLVIDERARVVDAAGRPFPNLFAGGGAACGVSGPEVSGYLSGNGLLTAIAFGSIAGHEAANLL